MSGDVCGMLSNFRLQLVTQPEEELHASVARLLDRLLLRPAQWTTFPAGNVPLPPRFAAKLARLGLKRGWPDILVVFRRVHGIELKRKGGVLSKTRMTRLPSGAQRELRGQADVFPELEAAGMPIAVCRSPDDVVDALVEWGIPLRGRLA